MKFFRQNMHTCIVRYIYVIFGKVVSPSMAFVHINRSVKITEIFFENSENPRNVFKNWENSDKCLQIFKNSEKFIDCYKKIFENLKNFKILLGLSGKHREILAKFGR